jgi:L-alanine-DL-glutamate epimerase-like enolase superfamily enzyme
VKITEIRTIVLATRIEQPIQTSFGTMTQRYMILVNIRTSSGLEGWGESWSNFPAWSPYERMHTIQDGFAPLLIGENPLETAQLHTKMRRASRILERQWGAPGPIAQAISALDIALWDIKAKSQEKPLYQLWMSKIPVSQFMPVP